MGRITDNSLIYAIYFWSPWKRWYLFDLADQDENDVIRLSGQKKRFQEKEYLPSMALGTRTPKKIQF